MITILKSSKDVRYKGKCECGCEFLATPDETGVKEYRFCPYPYSVRLADCPECFRSVSVIEERNP